MTYDSVSTLEHLTSLQRDRLDRERADEALADGFTDLDQHNEWRVLEMIRRENLLRSGESFDGLGEMVDGVSHPAHSGLVVSVPCLRLCAACRASRGTGLVYGGGVPSHESSPSVVSDINTVAGTSSAPTPPLGADDNLGGAR